MKQLVNLNDNTKNILLMVSGIILLLYAFGLFRCVLTTLVVIVGLLMFFTGFTRGGYWGKVKSLVGK